MADSNRMLFEGVPIKWKPYSKRFGSFSGLAPCQSAVCLGGGNWARPLQRGLDLATLPCNGPLYLVNLRCISVTQQAVAPL